MGQLPEHDPEYSYFLRLLYINKFWLSDVYALSFRSPTLGSWNGCPLCESGIRKVVVAAHFERNRETRNMLLAFARSIQERDVVTYEHSRRVATYAQRLARYLGWSRREARDLSLAALVHDLGKTWIANDILNKTGALSEEERRKMERHPIIGARILIGCDIDPFYVEAVLYHHESWDGKGYPAGLQGEQIPLSARILKVADVYDVLTSERPYKAAVSVEEACKQMEAEAGIFFDPTIIQAFLGLVKVMPNFTIPHKAYPLNERSIPYMPFLEDF